MTDFDINADPDARPYFEGLAEGVIRIQYCPGCDCHQFPPRMICTRCGSRDVTWRQAQGSGRIYAITVAHRAAAPQLESIVPYAVALIDLTEGVRLMARSADSAQAQQARIGMAVTVLPEKDPLIHPTAVFELAEPVQE
jgi:hypothetical protein